MTPFCNNNIDRLERQIIDSFGADKTIAKESKVKL